MIANKCDRCGKYYDKNRIEKTSRGITQTRIGVGICYRTSSGDRIDNYDLCDACQEDFLEFMFKKSQFSNVNKEEKK